MDTKEKKKERRKVYTRMDFKYELKKNAVCECGLKTP